MSHLHVGKKYTASDIAAVRTKLLSQYPNKSCQELADMLGLRVKTFKTFLADKAGVPTVEKIRDWLAAQPAK